MVQPQRCAEKADLQGLIDGTLPEDEQASVAAHLESCEGCRRQFEEIAGQSEVIPRVADFDMDSAPRSQALDAAMRKLKNGVEGPEATATGPTAGPFTLGFLDASENPRHLGRLSGYEIVEVIGRGGMGTVLKARDPKLERLVAVKVLNPELAASSPARLRFLQEARSAASVTHDHVVTIHAVDDSGDVPFLVMEYVVGASLADVIQQRGSLPLEEVLRIGMQVSSGLAAAHALGLVHRDIKPSNILLENCVTRVKITDFGLVRVMHEAQLTQTDAVAGTPQYMSPEQATGEKVDHRSDLFSLGCVMYAMCTGRSPFRAETPIAVLRRVCEDTPRPIQETNPEIPDWLAAIIDRLLAKRPEDRFQSAGEIAGILEQCLADVQGPARTRLRQFNCQPVGCPMRQVRHTQSRSGDHRLHRVLHPGAGGRPGTGGECRFASVVDLGHAAGKWFADRGSARRQRCAHNERGCCFEAGVTLLLRTGSNRRKPKNRAMTKSGLVECLQFKTLGARTPRQTITLFPASGSLLPMKSLEPSRRIRILWPVTGPWLWPS